MRDELLGYRHFRFGLLITRTRRLLLAVRPLLDGSEIGQHELGIDHLDVADRVDRSGNVVDVVIFKAPNDLHDRVYLADVGEELIAETFTRARALHEARDVDELDR